MKRIRLLSALTALLLPMTTTAFAQDAEPSPEAGDTGAMGGEEMGTGGDTSAPAADAPAADAAPGSGPAKPISVGLLLGYGLGFDLKGGPNPWGLGFGARGGYNLGQVYLGARFVFYLGGSKKIPSGFGGTVSADLNIWELGVEVGYDLAAGEALTIRPELGVGMANASASIAGSSASDGNLFLAPGASLLYDVSDDIFLGVDARFQLVFANSTGKALILLANGGMHF